MSSNKSALYWAAVAIICLTTLGGVGLFGYYKMCEGFCSAGELPIVLMLFFVLPLVGSLAASLTVYASRALSPWTYPMIVWSSLPLAALVKFFISFPFVDVAPAAQNTQGTVAAGMLTIVAIIFLLVCLGIITIPLMTSVAIWAEKDLKKYFITFGIAFVLMFLFVHGAFDPFVSSLIEYMN